jgi:hypothetical protein
MAMAAVMSKGQTVTISANRLAGLLSGMFPNPDDPGPFGPREIAGRAAQVVLIAQALEISGVGGSRFANAVLDDPENWCGTNWPHFPIPKKKLTGDEVVTLGAAFVELAGIVKDSGLANQFRDGGAAIVERGASMGA